jgi:cytochrome c oxidase accessory protein FixG
VFGDVFAALARRIEGWRGTRRPSRVAPWRRAATHLCFALASAAIAFHLVAYFQSPYALADELARGTLTRRSAVLLGAITVLAYLDFALVRQTFCKFLCPYARLQGVLFDRDTLVVAYAAQRGEPRGPKGRASGDCVDCGLCVAVCPTQIDIRNGLQLECIACTQCIDVCNGVMQRLGRPRDLIGYRSLAGVQVGRAVRWLRPRTAVYALLLGAALATFVGLLARRLPLELQVARNMTSLYTTMPDGRIGNAFTLHIENRDRAQRSFRLRLSGPERFELIAGLNPIPMEPTSAAETRVFVVAPAGGHDAGEIGFVLEDAGDARLQVERRAPFYAPGARDDG